MILAIIVVLWFSIGIVGVYIGNLWDAYRGIKNTTESVLFAFGGAVTFIVVMVGMIVDMAAN